MQIDATDSHEKTLLKPAATEADLAPVSPISTAAAADSDLLPARVSTENAIHLEPKKREKTWGEKRFNWLTYGGFGLLGNEITSLAIMEQVRHADKETGIKAGRLNAKYVEYFESLFTKLNPEKFPEYITKGRIATLLTATVGGMLMVLPIKWLEDHKGSIVRKFDRDHFGRAVDNNPQMLEAHQEMDEAPRQSWGSLMKGRVITVVSALAADAAFGWKHSYTGKMESLGKYRSLDHIAEEASHRALKLFKTNRIESPRAFETMHTLTWLLALSTSLTALFYVTSKMFAKEGAIQKEKRLAKQVHRLERNDPDHTLQDAPVQEKTPKAEISHVSYEQPIHAASTAIQPTFSLN